MSDDLAKRLRGWARDIREGSTATWAMAQDLKSAALRIEELEAELANAMKALVAVVVGMIIGNLLALPLLFWLYHCFFG